MGIFGWSMPPGCNSTPFDDAGASDLKVPGLPVDFGVFWTEDGEILLQQFGGEQCRSLNLTSLEWDDDKDDEQNFAAARLVAQGALQKIAPDLAIGRNPF